MARRRRRRRGGGPQDLEQTVGKVLRRLVPADAISLYRVQLAFEGMAPELIRPHAWPVWLKGGRLIVAVQDNQWLHELSWWRQELLDRLRSALPDVRLESLDIRLGKVPPIDVRSPSPTGQEAPVREPPLPRDPPPETISALRAIEDPKLRELAAAARLWLGTPHS